MTRLILVPLLCLSLGLVGCASKDAPGGSPIIELSKLTVADLQAALARATKADDKPAMQCYPVLISLVQGVPGQASAVLPAGVVDAFEVARLFSKQAQTFSGASNPMIQAINLGCAALFNDTQGDLLRLGIKFRP